jgi:heat shock protein HslJ
MRENTTGRTATLRRVVPLAVALLLVAGCSDPEDPSDTSDPGATSSTSTDASPTDEPAAPVSLSKPPNNYLSTDVQGRDLVEGSRIRMTFNGETLSIYAGCNTLVGDYQQSDDGFAWVQPPAMTMKACGEEEASQDEWLAAMFTEGVTMVRELPELTVTSGDVTITFTLAPKRDLQDIFAKTWRLTGTITDGSMSRVPNAMRRPRVTLGGNGLGRLDTGCNSGRITVTADETSINFGPPAITRIRCQDPAAYVEEAMLAVMDGRSDYVIFYGAMLIIYKGGAGLVFDVV